METTRFNQTQIHLLRMFELESSEASLNELKEVLYRYYSKRIQRDGPSSAELIHEACSRHKLLDTEYP